MFRLSILLCASAVSTAIKHRNVTFWYTPAAYGGGKTIERLPQTPLISI